MGVNVFYENVAVTVPTATGTSTTRNSHWSGVPNLGADLEFGAGKSVGILFRPDWTFASDDTFFTGTVGVDFPLS